MHALLTGAGGRKVRLKSTAEQMSEWIGWESRLPKPVTLRGKLRGDLRLHEENISTYAGKFTAAPKAPYVKDGEVEWGRDRSAHSAPLAIGALFAWSQIPLLQAVQPIGPFGESLHGTWLRKMRRARNVGAQSLDASASQFSDNWREIIGRNKS